MESLYIADDEKIIRDGLKYIVDWEALGYEICGESGTGDEALEDIVEKHPTIAMMDIKMPGMTGLEVIRRAREAGYMGRFIILSGYSNFEYAKEAMKYDVNYYLTKPIDEDELIKTVREINQKLEEEQNLARYNNVLKEKSKKEIVLDLVLERGDTDALNLEELGLSASKYQVIAYESFDQQASSLPYQFADLFQAANKGDELFEHFKYKNIDYLLLKGGLAIEKMKRFVSYYEDEPEKGSPLDTLFITCGQEVTSYMELPKSFDQARLLIERRFFCTEGQHVFNYEDLPAVQKNLQQLDKQLVNTYSGRLTGYLQAFNRRKVAEDLYELQEYLFHVDANIADVKIFLTDMYLQIKDSITHNYSTVSIPFDTNTEIIGFISTRNYLYEIIVYCSKAFEMVMMATGNSTRDSVMDDILYYIEHNYHSNLKLETIATLFGYNSSYLGKVFNKTTGESFNTYVDKVRINKALELLEKKELKVYEVSDSVGYRNVDYFHKKFRKYVGQSPAEYRKSKNIDDEDNT